MQIQMVSISDIKPYSGNPRQNEDAVKYVRKSIEEFGFKIPMVLDSNNVIVCGHTRLLAAKEIGMAEVPCVYADGLTDEQIRAYRLADNKTAEIADWDYVKLAEEIEAMLDFDFSDFGGDPGIGREVKPIEAVEDVLPEEAAIDVFPGQIYKLGSHLLMCGDIDDMDAAKLAGGHKARILFCSADGLGPDAMKECRKYADYICLVMDIKREGKRVERYWDAYIDKAAACGLKLLSWNVWDREAREHAFILVFGEEPFGITPLLPKTEGCIKVFSRNNGKRQSDGSLRKFTRKDTTKRYKKMESVISVPESEGRMPVKVPSMYIQSMTKPGEAVFCPACGTGEVLIAAEQTGRICYAMEKRPELAAIIIKRWEAFTGQKAELVP